MDKPCEYISYESTGYFSRMMIDYVNGDKKLESFYKYPVSLEGIKSSIEARKKFDTPRQLLTEELRKQYAGIALTEVQQQNLDLLLQPNTFTICTAHQPNIFTGHLYFIYKILHAIKLANYLNSEIPECRFVPVYYMGSEDADLDELGHINLNGEKLNWQTKQTGAVGRMKVDKQLIGLIDEMSGQLEILEYGKKLLTLFRDSYREGVSIQDATLQLVNSLFADFGLIVLLPDNKDLKKYFNPIVKKELADKFSHKAVEETAKQLGKDYKVQASGRDINLFYLTDTKRERIEQEEEKFTVTELKLSWTLDEILMEADEHPERFSANVILRGVFQEMILPNIAFIGGGGEIAYWLELKKVFEDVEVPFPVLIVRNSFLLINQRREEIASKLGFEIFDLFKTEYQLINELVTRESNRQLSLDEEKEQLRSFYTRLEAITDKIDVTLSDHTKALQSRALDKVNALEKKMLKAEKRKFQDQQRQISKLKEQLFPDKSLQERVDNFSSYYALYGQEWLNKVYEASLCLEQQFGILKV